MRVVVQRVLEASVRIKQKINGKINKGLLVFVGIKEGDSLKSIEWLSNKIVNLRIFSDAQGKMNLSVKDIDGEILIISQFTLYANANKGTRPSYVKAAKPQIAIPLYEQFIQQTQTDLGKPVATGIFGADMKISLLNDGPVTLVIDSKV